MSRNASKAGKMTAVCFEVPVLHGIEGHVHAQFLGLVEDIDLYDALRVRWDVLPCSRVAYRILCIRSCSRPHLQGCGAVDTR